MLRTLLLLTFSTILLHTVLAEGSKNLTPTYGTGDGTINNNFIGYLCHSQESGITGNFLEPGASADEKLYIYVKQGETLYMGLRRIDPVTNDELRHQDLTIVIRENDGTLVTSFTLDDNDAVTDADGDSQGYPFTTPQTGVIESYAEVLAGPAAVVGASGYDALSWTNNIGDQEYYIEFIQFDGGSTNGANDIGVESWYDLWDFSVYDGLEEKEGRLHSKNWGFSAGSFDNQFSDDFQLYVKVPSVISGSNAGNYIKSLDFAGLQPYTTLIYANSTGASLGSTTDLNGDGITDFLDARRTQSGNIGATEYDIFINNPDVDIYTTTTLPEVTITDANFYCNASGTGGEGVIYFESNQSGIISIIIDMNGTIGYQDGTTDVILEQSIDASSGSAKASMKWDGLDGLGTPVGSGTVINISGRFTAGAVHTPLFDPEINAIGINMLDVRPATSFDLIYWDDRSAGGVGSSPSTELTGSNSSQHTWTTGNGLLVNTWSFGYYQINTENTSFSYNCDQDGDGVTGTADLDSDNDGLSDAEEGDHDADTDGDGVPDYLDPDVDGDGDVDSNDNWADVNHDGVNDNFDNDLDGIPDAIDLDNDNDGIPDIIEFGLADSDNDGRIDGFTDANGNGLNDAHDPACDGNPITINGNATSQTNTGVTNADNAVGAPDGVYATTNNAGDQLNLYLGQSVPSSTTVYINMSRDTGTGNLDMTISRSADGVTYDGGQTVTINQNTTATDYSYVLPANSSYIRIQPAGATVRRIYHISYSFSQANPCSGGSALNPPDTDADGIDNYRDLDSDNDGIVDTYEAGGTTNTSTGQIADFTDSDDNGLNDQQQIVALAVPDADSDGFDDYLDIDSDNDGIPDNFEGQGSSSHVDIAVGDSNSNGLLDIYDPTNGSSIMSPLDTDGDGIYDFRDSDADGDGVNDIIEGWDSDINGFADWDAIGSDNDISNETGYNADADADGLWDIFDNTASTGIANIIGSNSVMQNTDGADESDWQDDDDDNDGSPTAGEDVNGNNDWTDDFTQGQGGSATVPDYLFRGDFDGDAIADKNDADSDNDGITDAQEANGEAIDPSGDDDNDGIPNYRDAGIAASLTSATDANGDGVFDVFDSDMDGSPDFLDLDSDNDGIWDAIEAYEGSVPNGLNETTGQFELNDPDNDGLMNYVDSSPAAAGGNSTLANPDSDGDGVKDYVDIDSDGDGIPDIIESQSTADFIALTNVDTDGDGIDDAFDPDNGGTLILPINTDGLDLQDYLDLDSDNDNVLDIVEGNDANNDGFGDWDDNTNGIADEADFIDSDGDGLPDAFDNVTLGTVGNETGSNAALQNTDGLDQLDFRDTDDDADGILTEDEDTNSNGNYQDDKTQGQGAANIPNYLFNGDYDKDGIADALDTDSDNDGVPDSQEDGGQSIDPSGDEDGDGIPNFRDTDDATVIAGLTSTADTNGDGVYDVYDHDMDGIPDFRDADSDNDGVPDLVEAGGTDADGDGRIDGLDDDDGDGIPNSVDADFTGGADVDDDGIDDAFDFSVAGGTDTDGDDIIDSADTDIDGDGLPNTYDTDNGGTALIPGDTDGDGINDLFDLDTDNDGIPDLVEAGGTDNDGNGKVDDATDSDNDGLADVIDSDNGGTALPIPDTDYDGIADFKDLDSDNDGITDAIENGGADTNSDGLIDGYASDTDGDGLADVVDPDNGGSPIANVDTDGDGIDDYLDLDSDNDGIPDLVEAGGVDTDFDGRVDDLLDADLDGIPYDVDVDQTGGTDADGDGIDDAFDASITGGNDNDNDGIDDRFDMDKDGNGYSDAIEANPLDFLDTDGDGNKNFRDIDSDNDGIVDVIEFGGTADPATGTISGFTDTDGDGFNDAQDGYIGAVVNGSVTPITPLNTDSGSEPASAIKPDYLDIDSDNDGIVDLIEAQSKATFIALSGVDANNNGLDDAFDPNLGATLLTPVATDGGNADYLDTDSDADGVLDRMEGSNADKNLYADWDADNDGNFDDAGYNTDVDEDGLLDIYDNVSSTGSNNITGSNAAVQDTDLDGIWDFQDVDDDNDGITTASESTSALADPNGITPDYLYGDQDSDNDGVDNDADLDADNDGVANASEDGGTGIDPGADTDADGLYNYQDFDIDGDAIANTADTNTSGINTTGFTDSNGDGVIDQFDKDLDGIPDFKDLDSDNDGIPDILEFGLTDANQDGTLDEGAGITDVNLNGIDDPYDASCDGSTSTEYAESATGNGSVTNPNNAVGTDNGTLAVLNNGGVLVLDFNILIPSNNQVSVNMYRNLVILENDPTYLIESSTDNVTYSTVTSGTLTSGITTNTLNFNLTQGTARYIRISKTNTTDRNIQIDYFSSNVTTCSGGVSINPPDFDSDGIDNYLDLDADADGIPDNIEAQSNLTYKAPVWIDSDGDGIMDIYDQDAGGALTPVNSDSNGNPDYLDTDSDDDGIPDVVEAWDSDMDGFGDWDTNGNNDPTDESGYGSDVDADGISYLFDSNSGRGTAASIIGSNASLQDTDADDTRDFRDTDDDNDGISTASEDFGDGAGGASDGDWTNDFTQGGLTVPDYLFSPDNDGDGILDSLDPDSDGDGIPNSIEYAGISYTNNSGPFDDDDGDGIYNYLDSDASGHTDANGDGVDDRFDHDKDGIPNFFDLDSDNDGIRDQDEATITNYALSGTPSASSVSATWGSPLSVVIDGDTDGFGEAQNNHTDQDSEAYIEIDLGQTRDLSVVNVWNRTDCCSDRADNFYVFISEDPFVATDVATTLGQSGVQAILQGPEAGTPSAFNFNASARYIRVQLTETDFLHLAEIEVYSQPLDTDGDGIPNYLDLDSDNDGLTDNREAQPSAGFIVITATDTDGDGLKDVYDADNGGTYIVPINSDSDGDPDYLDTDSDDDNVLDVVEGFDANKNGFSDLDTNQDGDLSDETGYGLDTDGDGLENIFDNYSGTGIANIKGSKSKRQDTDGDGTPDYRDDEDDSDGIDTSAEDTSDGAGGGADGIYYNDKSQGGGATPDYLFFNDTDDDGIADGLDLDSDNDGIIDDDEAAGVTYTGASGPFDDDDNDGLFNYRDADATNFVDADGDGIDDRVDADSDGIPNFFDLDSDNDGIPDGVEANRGTLPTGQNTNGQFPPSATDVDDDGLADNVDGGSVSTLANPDTDGDGIPDFLDLDSDSDGITDLLEAGGNDYNGDGKLDSFGDTDGDGLGNSVDVDNGGTPLTIPNSDGTGRPNYIDADSEDDGTPDFEEGFYEAGPTNYRNSYINRVTAYNAANVATSNTLYPTGDTSPADGTPDYLNDSDGDGIPNLLDPQSAYFLDDDGDGLINLFDPDQNGDFYGNVNGVPDRDSDGNPNILDGSDVPLPLDFISFSGTALNENVTLKWTTANEVNVSHFEVLHSTAGSQDFKVVGTIQAVNIKELVNDYQFTHQNAPAGYNFYRIREVDLDGFEGFTEIINVVVEASNISWTLYPNPAQNHLSIRSTVVIPDSRVMIMDVTGRTLYDQHISFESKAAEFDLSRLGAGVYHIIIELPDSKKSFRVIKK
ncbi:discoidin domain-containing protein [Marinoscillum sp.]|uniref:discoidin domain-containing protein n=1 Tax=Marinoscillum sp. TaxID=2024838 RepID=UPI003BAB5C5A